MSRIAGHAVAAVVASTCAPLLAAAPEITGGDYLSVTKGENLQPVLSYETSDPFEVVIFDPDEGDSLSYQIIVDGPLGGVIGGADVGYAASGVPVSFQVRFIAGVVAGASWIRIQVSDGTSTVTRFINFEISSHPTPPGGQFFRVSHVDADWPYHFNVLVTDPTQIQKGLDVLAGRIAQQIVGGNVVKGDAGWNVNLQDPEQASWSWYLDPESVVFAEAFIEVCDGSSCLIEAELDYWVNQIGFYCPWATHLLGYDPELPADSLELRLTGGDQTVVHWEPVAGATRYDVARGSLSSLALSECSITLGPMSCVAEDTPLTSTLPDQVRPPAGEVFFYVARYAGPSTDVDWGTSSSVFYREGTSGCAP